MNNAKNYRKEGLELEQQEKYEEAAGWKTHHL